MTIVKSYKIGFRLRHIHGVMLKSLYQLGLGIEKVMNVDGEEGKQIRSCLVDSATMLGQAMVKTSHFRVSIKVGLHRPVLQVYIIITYDSANKLNEYT